MEFCEYCGNLLNEDGAARGTNARTTPSLTPWLKPKQPMKQRQRRVRTRPDGIHVADLRIRIQDSVQYSGRVDI